MRVPAPSDGSGDQLAWPFESNAPAAWILGNDDLQEIARLVPAREWRILGPRWFGTDEVQARRRADAGVDSDADAGMGGDADAGVDAAAANRPTGVVALLGAGPAELPRLADAAIQDGADTVVTVDWPLPGVAASARHATTGGHLLWIHETRRQVSFTEHHQLLVCHPQYDGFVVAYVVAHRDIQELRVIADPHIADAVRPHWAPGPLLRGQVRPIDLQLRPQGVAGGVLDGMLRAADGAHMLPGDAHRLTVATSRRTTCAVAGDGDDSALDAAEVERLSQLLVERRLSPASVAGAIERAERLLEEPAGTGMAAVLARLVGSVRGRIWGTR